MKELGCSPHSGSASPLSASGMGSPLKRTNSGTASGVSSPFQRTLSSPSAASPLARTRSLNNKTFEAMPPQVPSSWRLVQDVFDIARDTASEVALFARTGSQDTTQAAAASM